MELPRNHTGPAQCRICRHRWVFEGIIADEPAGTSDLLCPNCGHRSGDFGHDEPEFEYGPEGVA